MRVVRWVLSCLICLTACRSAAPSVPARAPNDGPWFTAAQLSEDFFLLRRVFEELHPGLYRYHTKASLDAGGPDLSVEALTFAQRSAPVEAALAARRGGDGPSWTLAFEGPDLPWATPCSPS